MAAYAIFAIIDVQVTLILPTKFQVDWPSDSGEAFRFRRSSKQIFKMAAMVAILDF